MNQHEENIFLNALPEVVMVMVKSQDYPAILCSCLVTTFLD